MPRIRSIKPSFFQHDKLSALHAEAQLLAAGLLCYADDEGYFLANPKLIQAAVFPLRELSLSLPELLQSLHVIGYVEFLKGTDDRDYGRVVKFQEHQRVSHPTPSTIKPLCEATQNIPEIFGKPPEVLRPELKGNRIEGNKELKGSAPQPPLNHAHRMIEVLSLPSTFKLKEVISAALMAEVTFTGNTLEQCAQSIADLAIRARAQGTPIDKFWFEDTKWRHGNGRSNKAEQALRDQIDSRNAARRAVGLDH